MSEGEEPIQAPVSLIDDRAKDGERPEGDQFDRPSFDRFTHELQYFRLSQERTDSLVREAWREVKEELGGIRCELGEMKDFMTRESLELAGIKGVEPNGLRGKTVLIVDDSLELLDVLRRLLFQLGVNAVGVSSRQEAEALLLPEANQHQFDAALIDLRLPHSAAGFSLARWVCFMYPKTGVIVMSGTLPPMLDRLPVAKLAKPFTLKTLTAALNDAIGHGPSLRPTERPPAFAAEATPPLERVPPPPRAPSFPPEESPTFESRISDEPVITPEPKTKSETPNAKKPPPAKSQ